LIFQNIQLGDAKVGFQTSQAQEKGNILRGIYSWGSIHTIFSIGNSGRGQAGNYYVDGANIAGRCVRVFNLNVGGWFPSFFDKIYCESIGSIGYIYSDMPISVSNSVFDFAVHSARESIILLSSNTYSGNKTKFENCTFRHYGFSFPLRFSGGAAFENCYFGGTPTGVVIQQPSYQNFSAKNDTVNVIPINIKIKKILLCRKRNRLAKLFWK